MTAGTCQAVAICFVARYVFHADQHSRQVHFCISGRQHDHTLMRPPGRAGLLNQYSMRRGAYWTLTLFAVVATLYWLAHLNTRPPSSPLETFRETLTDNPSVNHTSMPLPTALNGSYEVRAASAVYSARRFESPSSTQSNWCNLLHLPMYSMAGLTTCHLLKRQQANFTHCFAAL